MQFYFFVEKLGVMTSPEDSWTVTARVMSLQHSTNRVPQGTRVFPYVVQTTVITNVYYI